MSVPTILVVDGDPSVRELFEELLRAEGYKTLLAEPHAVSVGAIAAARPDLLLLELTSLNASMGLALTEGLRYNMATAALPVLVLSTDQQLIKNLHDPLQRLGCVAILKPFDLERLLETIQHQLERTV